MNNFLLNLFINAKKVFLVVVVIFSTLAFFSYFLSHETSRISINTEENPARNYIYKTIKDPTLNSSPAGKYIVAVYRSWMCGFVGEGCTDNPTDGNNNFDRSLSGKLVGLITIPYTNPPASGVYWTYNGLQNAGFMPKSYAAEGVGFASLRPIEGLWKIFRDIAYILLVLVLIVIGFMIMFRVKINPQTVVRLENSLPRIVLSLVLITFSFAIAGFLIDLMYVIILVSISTIARVNIGRLTSENIPSLQNKYIGAGLAQLWPFGGDPFQVGIALVNILPSIVKGIFKTVIAFIMTRLIIILVNGMDAPTVKEFVNNFKGLSGTAGGGASALGFGGSAIFGFGIGEMTGIVPWLINFGLFILLFPYAAGFLLGLLFVLTLFFFIFRVLFILFGAYIKILLLIIFAPIILLAGAIPGRNVFIFWLKHLIAELITFPLVIIIMLVGYAITSSPLAEGRLFRPPFLYSIPSESFAVLIGMGIILLIPNLIKVVKEMFGIKGPGIGVSAGLFFGGVSGATGGALDSLSKIHYSSMGIKVLTDKWKGIKDKARPVYGPPAP